MKSFVLVLIVSLSLAACGDGDSGGSGGSGGASGSSGGAGGDGGAAGTPSCPLTSDACTACVEDHCMQALMACSSASACEGGTLTLQSCACPAQQSGDSVQPCLDKFKEGSAEAGDVVTCVEQSCSSPCGL